MSSMLEQAIVDAQALREAALKNAEQALIEKFAPQIKDAVESLLEESSSADKTHSKVKYEGQIYNVMEVEDGKMTLQNENTKPFVVSEAECSSVTEEDLLQEEEVDADPNDPSGAEEDMMEPLDNAPFAFQGDEDQEVMYSFKMSDFENELDLGDMVGSEEKQEKPVESYDDLAADVAPEEPAMDLGNEEEDGEEDDILAGLDLQEEDDLDESEIINEIIDLINEMGDEEDEELLEEELIVDMLIGSDSKDGTFRTDKETLQYYEEMRKAKEYAEAKAEENENLKETLKRFKLKNKQYKDAVEKLSDKLNETLLSNAKLIYSNKTLGDASLNERQKSKIVEAIAKARTPEEARNLHEALNATVTSGKDNKSPRTLSESVTRKSTLSGILPRRKQQVNESEEHTFAEHMKKLAGIK
jgi:hypothetical protein